jgi:hypothetical protein
MVRSLSPLLHTDDGVNCVDGNVVLDSDIDMRKERRNTEIAAVMSMCIAPKSYEGVCLGRHGLFPRTAQ